MVKSLRFASNIRSISEVVEAILGKKYRFLYDIILLIYLLNNTILMILSLRVIILDTITINKPTEKLSDYKYFFAIFSSIFYFPLIL